MIKKSFGASLQTTDTTLYTVPVNKRAEWVLIYATDTSGSTTNFDIDMYDASSGATLKVLDGYGIGSNDFFKVGGEPNSFVMLEAGDKIIGRCASNDSVTCLVSIIETNALVSGG